MVFRSGVTGSRTVFEEHQKKVEAIYDLFFTKWKETIIQLTEIYLESEGTLPVNHTKVPGNRKRKRKPHVPGIRWSLQVIANM
jgi:hypothetical protein